MLSQINGGDRKSTRLNSSHRCISYAVFCLKKKSRKRVFLTSPCARTIPRTAAHHYTRVLYCPVTVWALERVTCTVLVTNSSNFFFFNDTATTEIYTLSLPTPFR